MWRHVLFFLCFFPGLYLVALRIFQSTWIFILVKKFFPCCSIWWLFLEKWSIISEYNYILLNTLSAGNGSKISSKTIVAILVPIAGCLVLFILGFCFLSKRAKRKNRAVVNKNGKRINYLHQTQIFFYFFPAITNQ